MRQTATVAATATIASGNGRQSLRHAYLGVALKGRAAPGSAPARSAFSRPLRALRIPNAGWLPGAEDRLLPGLVKFAKRRDKRQIASCPPHR